MARTEVVSNSRHVVYLERAREFEGEMDRAAAEGAWNSVGLLGVHCAISTCDALTVQRTGQRWSGQDHGGVIGMVGSLGHPDADRALRQVTRVLEAKNRVEYESREFTEKESEEVRQSVSRVLNWVTPLLSR
jgi:hypothetical protein